MRKLLLVLMVAMVGAWSFGEIVINSNGGDEEGFIRSDEFGGEYDKIRIGCGESEGRTFVSFVSFDTSSLSGLSITEGYLRLTLNDSNPIWGGDGQNGPGEEGWMNPDDELPWIDIARWFGAGPELDWSDNGEDECEDRDYDGEEQIGGVHADARWGFDTLMSAGDQLFIYLNADALAFLSSWDAVQLRIGTDNAGPGDPSGWSAMDFYDGNASPGDAPALVLIPEPATMLLLGLGGLLLRRRK